MDNDMEAVLLLAKLTQHKLAEVQITAQQVVLVSVQVESEAQTFSDIKTEYGCFVVRQKWRYFTLEEWLRDAHQYHHLLK